MTEKKQILKSTSVITLATLASRLLGYIRDQRIALLLGTSVLSDSFFLAFRIPNLLRRLVAEGALSASWDCLRRTGNLSSASVLFVLEEVMMKRRPAPGTYSILAAMGPGFCSELVLLRW